MSSGHVARPPLFRLLGIEIGHVAPGSLTLTMPASAWLLNGYGHSLDVQQLVEAALTGAAITGLAPATDLDVVSLSIHYLRPILPNAGRLLARARVVTASRLMIYTEVEVEDATGRRLVHASTHSTIHAVDPPPPAAPANLPRIEEPDYSKPDPVLRAVPSFPTPPPMETSDDPVEVIRGFVDGRFRSATEELLGIRMLEVDAGRSVGEMPASEWFQAFDRTVSVGSLALISNMAGSIACLTLLPRGTHFGGLEGHVRMFRPVPADGRAIRAVGAFQVNRSHGYGDMTLIDADGDPFASVRGTSIFVDATERKRRQHSGVRRVLATLLFIDIVEATAHAGRLGDSGWRELLAEFRDLTRTAIARSTGVEVDTAGDGFFVHFESPGSAIECARSVRDGVARLGIKIRAGIHTGECEFAAGKPTGMVVHAAARIQGAAAPGEILASDTVRVLLEGSGVRFDDRGAHTLKGVPNEWQLHAVGA